MTGGAVAFLLALAIVPFSTSFSTTVQAMQAVTATITLQSTVNQNRDVTLTFNKPVSMWDEDYLSLIEDKKTNEGAYTSLAIQRLVTPRISNTGALVLSFNDHF
ncbi:hypothetical protein [Paenibacillus alba]|uniref:SbsA Ig-like domain-containing protein n=1 Tax=Paenibacillus alba TaxID=1197127 RepID=A0ABU6FXQ4_9BACL|nr:hypothetical protein [Paenibacillus alba]MEC0226697.1 hypothetical protein [Paenibacillus alba]